MRNVLTHIPPLAVSAGGDTAVAAVLSMVGEHVGVQCSPVLCAEVGTDATACLVDRAAGLELRGGHQQRSLNRPANERFIVCLVRRHDAGGGRLDLT
jgi:hypothetical protein